VNDEYRPTDYPGYVVNAQAVVWSVGRRVKTKGGATRTTAAKPLKPDEKGRVALRRDGKTIKVRVDDLALKAFPPTRHYVRSRRITLHCRWCGRSFDGFTTWWCENAPVVWPDLFRCPCCTTAVITFPPVPIYGGTFFNHYNKRKDH
jgi:hypothetical protein